mgnify:CR=1 FL=1|jgi:hypothetical protein
MLALACRGNIIDFDFAEDGPTKAFCTQHGGPNKDACVYPDQLEPHGLERVAAAFDHLRVLGCVEELLIGSIGCPC